MEFQDCGSQIWINVVDSKLDLALRVSRTYILNPGIAIDRGHIVRSVIADCMP